MEAKAAPAARELTGAHGKTGAPSEEGCVQLFSALNQRQDTGDLAPCPLAVQGHWRVPVPQFPHPLGEHKSELQGKALSKRTLQPHTNQISLMKQQSLC